jgi:hypothetical protein
MYEYGSTNGGRTVPLRPARPPPAAVRVRQVLTMPESLAFIPGSLVGLPHHAGDWLASSAAGRAVQVVGGISVRHHRAGVVEIVDVAAEVSPTAVRSLTALVQLLGRLHHRAMVVASRLPLDLLRERLGEVAGDSALALLLDAGITVVAPATRHELLAAGRGLGRAVPIRHPGGTWLLPPRSPPDDRAAPPPTSFADGPTRRLDRASRSVPAARTPGSADPEIGTVRSLNVRLTDDGGSPLPSGLRLDTRYLLRVAVGPCDGAGPVADAPSFPVDQLPHTDTGWELDVVVTAEPGSVEPYRAQLFLPLTGGSWTCDCPARVAVHGCSAGLRRQWLDVGLHTAPRPGTMAVVVRVYHGAVLLQAVEVSATVGGPDDTAVAGALVYCRDPKLGDLSRHTGRAVSCHLDGTATGRHSLVVNNGHDNPVYFGFVDERSATAAAVLRQVLYDTQLGAGAVPRHRIGSAGQPVKDPPDYLVDLRRLAGAGAQVYRALMVDSDDERRLHTWLAEAAGRAPVIQLARSTNSRLSIPWQMLYDEPLVDGPAAADVCDSVWRWGPGSTETSRPARCPDAARHDPGRGTICPFGFWGFAHVVEVPPSTSTHLLPRCTSDATPPQLVAAVDDTLPSSEAHLRRLGTLLDGDFPVATSWAQLRAAAAAGSDVLYFYCPGSFGEVDGLPTRQPVLDLGGSDPITAARLGAWAGRTRWQRRRPLVFLNGCSTGEMMPGLLATFVDAFVNSLHGAGVLATEVAVEGRAAQYAAEAVLRHLWRGRQTGDAVRAMRWDLLAHGSVLGLAYTPYCDASLTLPSFGPPPGWE